MLGELVTDFLRELDRKTLVYIGQSCEQLVDVRADFIGKLLYPGRVAEPVGFPCLSEDLVELDLCVVSGVRDTLLALVFLFLGRCCQRLLAFLFGQPLTIELLALRRPSGQGLLTFFLGFALCGFLFCLGTTLCGFPFCLGTTLCGFLFSLQAFLILGIDFGQVLEDFVGLLDLESVVSGDFVGLLDLESVVSGEVQEDPAAIAENEQGNTRREACDAVADKVGRQFLDSSLAMSVVPGCRRCVVTAPKRSKPPTTSMRTAKLKTTPQSVSKVP